MFAAPLESQAPDASGPHPELPVTALVFGAEVLGIAPDWTVSGCPSDAGRSVWRHGVRTGREVLAGLMRPRRRREGCPSVGVRALCGGRATGEAGAVRQHDGDRCPSARRAVRHRIRRATCWAMEGALATVRSPDDAYPMKASTALWSLDSVQNSTTRPSSPKRMASAIITSKCSPSHSAVTCVNDMRCSSPSRMSTGSR